MWILGFPKNLGQVEIEGRSLWYSGKERALARCRERSLLATLLSIPGIGFFSRGQYESDERMLFTLLV